MGKKGHSEIRNKEVRTLMYQKLKKEKLKEKKKKQIENKDKPKQTPKTIENCRIIDETYVTDLNNDPELQLDLRTDEISRHLNGRGNKVKEKQVEEVEEKKEANGDDDDDERKIQDYESKLDKTETESIADDDEDEEEETNKEPKVLITTHDITISFKTYKLCRELARILPNASYFYRKNVRLTKIIPEAIKRDYSAMIVINEDRKVPNGMTICLLPEGPTMNFKLTNVLLSDDLKNGGVHQFTRHKPEIMLNNFNTRLGLQIGRSFAALFPHDPQYEGRHVITFHNQRDFVFFRHHRYIFRDAKKVGLLELGPKFTLKLRSLQKGTFNSKFGEYEWIHKRHEMESSRRKFSI